MKFTYLGAGETEVFGLRFRAGEAVDVADEYAIRKLTHNHLFSSDEAPAEASEPPKRRGRPPKVKNDAEE